MENLLIKISSDIGYIRGQVDALVKQQQEDHNQNRECIEKLESTIFGNGKWGIKKELLVFEIIVLIVVALISYKDPNIKEFIKNIYVP